MKKGLVSFLTGFIFALGLGISGMTSPVKVVGFLDIFGSWDPTLMFVMIGAIGVHTVIYHLVKKKSAPLFESEWQLPTSKKLTPSLIFGAVLFGMGWALAGLCPGPAITSIPTGDSRVIIFVASMLFGMGIFKVIDKKMKFIK